MALTSDKDGAAGHVWIRLKISTGYHVYGKIERKSAYRPLTVELQLPDGITTPADWEYPAPEQSNGNPVYFDSVTLRRPLLFGQLKGPVTAVVRYQACNDEVCFPPVRAVLTATLD